MIALLLALAAAPSLPADLVAFPGAEGAGRLSQGGRGGRVIRVTNLEDSGPGSLRAAIEAKGPPTIVFAGGGTTALKKPLVTRGGGVGGAGQTARGGGIGVKTYVFEIAGDEVGARYARARLGDE